MNNEVPGRLRYQRERFAMEIPAAYLYSPTHFWIAPQVEDIWRVGLTKFGTRMLGEMVDHAFSVAPGAVVVGGQVIGWVEGFKAISDLVCLVKGRFVGGNPALVADLNVVNRDPHGEGWLYAVRGQPDAKCITAEGYVKVLDQSIDELIEGLENACGT